MKLVILTDSYGSPRIHANTYAVQPYQTYPEIIKEALKNDHTIVIDHLSYRKTVELPALIEKHNDADVFVLQSGVVDAYPRVLNQKNTLSQEFIYKLIRRIVRLNRSFFIKYISNKPWTTQKDYETAVQKIIENKKQKFIWINIAPVNKYQDKDTPGANGAIKIYNDILEKNIKGHSNHYLLDIYNILISKNNYEGCMHKVDSHLNVEGNKLYAECILKILNKII